MANLKNGQKIAIAFAISAVLTIVLYVLIKPLFTQAPMVPSSGVVVGFPEDFSPNSAKYFPKEDIFIVNDGKGIFAVTSLCSHLKCKLDWNSKESEFECGCHGSEFNLEGEVLKSPAQKPLERYEISFEKEIGIIVNKDVSTEDKAIWSKPPYYLPASE